MSEANFERVVAQLGHGLYVQEAEASRNVGRSLVNSSWIEQAEPLVEAQYLFACEVGALLVLAELLFAECRSADGRQQLAHICANPVAKGWG